MSGLLNTHAKSKMTPEKSVIKMSDLLKAKKGRVLILNQFLKARKHSIAEASKHSVFVHLDSRELATILHNYLLKILKNIKQTAKLAYYLVLSIFDILWQP